MVKIENKKLEHGIFSRLATDYSAYRPAYSQSIVKALLAILEKPSQECDFADVGAGTGIWTRMISSRKPKTIIAIEPSDNMRTVGMNDSKTFNIKWIKGCGEQTNLYDSSVDMVSMASSFHWVNFQKGVKEFHRILKQRGRFVAVWNPRLIEANPLLLEIEQYLLHLKPDLKRVSSGRSGLTETLTEQLYSSGLFTDVIYLEGRHTVRVSLDHYLGAWRSVNDVQFQLGKEKFQKFLSYIQIKFSNANTSDVDVTYQTRAWSALKI